MRVIDYIINYLKRQRFIEEPTGTLMVLQLLLSNRENILFSDIFSNIYIFLSTFPK